MDGVSNSFNMWTETRLHWKEYTTPCFHCGLKERQSDWLISCTKSVIRFISLCSSNHFVTPSLSNKVLHCFPGRSPLFGHFSTTLLGLDTIRAFRVEGVFTDQMNAYQDAHTRAWFMFISTAAWLSYRLDLLCVIFICFVALVSPALKTCKCNSSIYAIKSIIVFCGLS